MAGLSTTTLARAPFEGEPPRVLIVASPYYAEINAALLAGARAEVEAWGATHELAEVPGALEIPPAIAMASRRGEFHAFVALGCVIRGETAHYDIVAGESARGLMALGLQGLCVGNGILTVDTADQARVRAVDGDKGAGAAAAALHLLRLQRGWAKPETGLGFLRDRLGDT